MHLSESMKNRYQNLSIFMNILDVSLDVHDDSIYDHLHDVQAVSLWSTS